MLALSIALVATNVATASAAWRFWRRLRAHVTIDPEVRAVLTTQPATGGSRGTRHLISVEILNPIELAGTRGRMLAVAGSLAPGLTRRLVYHHTLKELRQQLLEQQVIADVRLHVLRADEEAALEATDHPPV